MVVLKSADNADTANYGS